MNLAIGLVVGAGVVIAVGLAAGAFIEAGDIDPDDGPDLGNGGEARVCPAQVARAHSRSEGRSRAAHPAGKRDAVPAQSDGMDRPLTHVLLDTIPTNGDKFVGLCKCGVLSLPVSSRESAAAWHLTHKEIERSIDTFAPGGES